MKILFTSVGRRVELMQAFHLAAKTENIELEIHGADISASAPALAFCDRQLFTPRIKDSEYVPFLVKYCKEYQINALVPTIDTDLLILSEHREEFSLSGTKVVISAPEKIKICRDKRLTAEYFNSAGLLSPVPVDNYLNYAGDYPAFIKPKDGSSSILAYKIENKEQLQTYANQIPDYIIQPFIEGTEYTVDVFCDFEGNPIYITPRIRLAVRSGEVLKTKIAQDGQIISEIKQLLTHYKPCGAITAQLIRETATGKDYYIEINPRFGGGAPLSMKSGANSAEALLKLLNGEKLPYFDKAAENGAVYSRFDQSIRVDK